jgi:hypothetical protein
MSRTQLTAALKCTYLEDDYKSDPWGVAISLLFDVCEVLTVRGDDVPNAYEYRPGCPGVSLGDGWHINLMMEANVEDLTHFGNVLHRIVTREESRGNSY